MRKHSSLRPNEDEVVIPNTHQRTKTIHDHQAVTRDGSRRVFEDISEDTSHPYYNFRDDIAYYLGKAASRPLLTPEEEKLLTRNIVDTRNALLRKMFSELCAQQEAISLYEDSLQATTMKEANYYFLRNQQLGNDSVKRGRESIMEHLEQIVRKHRALRLESMPDRMLNQPHCLPYTEDFLKLIGKDPFSIHGMKEVMRKMELLQSSLEEYQEHWKEPDRSPELKAIVKENLVNPKRFCSIVEEVKMLFTEWINLRNKIAMANTRLTFSIAKRYRMHGRDVRDTISDGTEGLMIAIDKFDPELGHKFSTYATWWIRQCIMRKMTNEGRMIRLPVHDYQVIKSIQNYIDDYAHTHGGAAPSDEIIAEGLSMTSERVQTLRKAKKGVASLDISTGEHGDRTMAEFMQDTVTPQPYLTASAHEEMEAIKIALRSLTLTERKIIILRFGLGMNEDGSTNANEYGKWKTLEEVADILEVTRERIRQIETRALKKLSNTSHPLRHSIQLHSEGTMQKKITVDGEGGETENSIALSEILENQRWIDTLERRGIYTIADYRCLSHKDKLAIPQMSTESLRMIDHIIEEYQLM